MDKRYMFIRDILNHKLQWTIKVNVTRDSGVQRSKDGKTTYRRVTLLDEKGTTIHASFFADEIKSFEDTLKCNKWYYITRGKLNKIKSEFSSGLELERDVQLILKKYTKIEEANVGEDGSSNMPVIKFDFLPLKDLPELSCNQQHIDIVAVVLNVSAEEKRKRKSDLMDVSLREITLTDSSLHPVVLSTWGGFIAGTCETLSEMLASMPIIMATNLRVKEIYGKKLLSTTADTDISINPDIPEATELEIWKISSKQELERLSKENFHVSIVDKAVTIESLLKSTNWVHVLTFFYIIFYYILKANIATNVGWHVKNDTHCIKAAIVNVLPQERSWYMACNNCKRKTSASHKSVFMCEGCHKESVSAEPCFCLRVEIGDSTGSIEAVIFGRQAEKIVSCKAEAIMNLGLEEQFDFLAKIMKECVDTDHVFVAKLVSTRNDRYLRITGIRDEE